MLVNWKDKEYNQNSTMPITLTNLDWLPLFSWSFSDMQKACQLLMVTKPCADFGAGMWLFSKLHKFPFFGRCHYRGGSPLHATSPAAFLFTSLSDPARLCTWYEKVEVWISSLHFNWVCYQCHCGPGEKYTHVEAGSKNSRCIRMQELDFDLV